MSSERSAITSFIDHIPRRPSSWYVIHIYDRIVHVTEEIMIEAGAFKGRALRLEVHRIRVGASRDRHGDVVWLDFTALHLSSPF
jgi:hypothetical protein